MEEKTQNRKSQNLGIKYINGDRHLSVLGMTDIKHKTAHQKIKRRPLVKVRKEKGEWASIGARNRRYLTCLRPWTLDKRGSMEGEGISLAGPMPSLP